MERRPIKSDVVTAAAVNGGGAEIVTADSPLMDRLRALERLIIKARSEPTTAAELSNLLRQLGFAITAAAEFAASERDRSLDALQCPDPDAARAQADDCEFLRNRLASQQSLLLARFQQVNEQETVTAYVAKRDGLRLERDTLERELTEVYSRAVGEIVDLFQRVNQFKQRTRRELGHPPPSVSPLPELAAGPLLDKVQLFQLDGQTQIWPPPNSFASDYILGMGIPQHPGPMWSDPSYQERVAEERRQEREKMAAHYEQAAREQTDRENRTLAENFAASQRRG